MVQKATFGAGCFWGVEHAFRQVEGVVGVVSGYMGGTVENPTYEQVCQGSSGHTEVVQVEYDTDKVTYAQLLQTFWNIHDPTQINKQGADVGYQYRSVIFYHTPEQKAVAEAQKAEHESAGMYNQPIATGVESASTFYRAEEYHQRYVEKNGVGVCI